MDKGVAPNAFLIPISFVLSLTAMSMMLLTPTMPATIVPIPIIHIKILIPVNRFINF